MEYFYEELVTRLENLNHEPILFVDLLCQMNDMISPNKEGNFSFEEIMRKWEIVGIFFNSLCNLTKFISFETRDMFAIKHQLNENPDFSDWDKFAKSEYERLASEEENQEDSDLIEQMNDVNNPDDSDEED